MDSRAFVVHSHAHFSYAMKETAVAVSPPHHIACAPSQDPVPSLRLSVSPSLSSPRSIIPFASFSLFLSYALAILSVSVSWLQRRSSSYVSVVSDQSPEHCSRLARRSGSNCA